MATECMRLAWLGLAWALAVPAAADEAAAGKPLVVGAATEAILARQRQGAEAGAPQPIAGEVAARSYKRYLDSYSKAMPEFNETIGTTTQSGGGTSH